ncbi:MAG: ROK family protein [Pseudomonadota bacterium]
MQQDEYVAALDAGGTSFKCALVALDGTLLSAWAVPTSTVDDTLARCAAEFEAAFEARGRRARRLGIASFGPVDVDPASATYGTILGTAKPGWQDAALGPRLSAALDMPFHLDSDVNAALLAEMRWGNAQHAQSAAYMTVGTGIGAGLFVNNGLLGRPTHPEFGHIRVVRHSRDQDFPGTCALHGDCLEGLASAAAFMARWGDPTQLPADHYAWEIEAFYLAQACMNLYLMARLECVILGGGLMQAAHLLPRVAEAFDALMGNYLPITGRQLISAPGCGKHAGVLGGAEIALRHL